MKGLSRRARALLVLVLGGASACTHLQPKPAATPEQQYTAAVATTAIPRPAAINRQLTALVPATEDLRWQEGKLLMVTWAPLKFYQDKEPGKPFTLAVDSWWTAAPRMQQWCQRLELQGDALHLRIAQRLGMPRSAPNDGFVEVWVEPRHIFRPCPDPEIQDHECQVEIPMAAPFQPTAGEPPWACSGAQVGEAFVKVQDSHLEWMCNTWRGTHGQVNPLEGYPWTALGYTYDWGSDNHVGFSEFVSLKGTEVIFHDRKPQEAYCTPSP
jgi:hypothetical protein